MEKYPEGDKGYIQKMRLTRVNEIPHPFIIKDHAKTEYIATIDHELRISLNSIIGFSELMKEKVQGELNEKQERYVHNVITSGKHLLDIIQQKS